MRVIVYGPYALRVTVLRHYYMHYIGLSACARSSTVGMPYE